MYKRQSLDLLRVLKSAGGVLVEPLWRRSGNQGVLRLNWTNPPFDNVAVRKAVQRLVIQPDIIAAVTDDPGVGQVCGAILMCGTADGSEANAEALLSKDPASTRIAQARDDLAQAGYKGERIVILDPADNKIPHAAVQVIADAMKRAGMNVDLQTTDWATVVARRAIQGAPTNGWHVYPTMGGPFSPSILGFSTLASAGCDLASPGWPCDAELERIRLAWVKEPDPGQRKILAEAYQRRAMDLTVYIPFGQFVIPAAWRTEVSGWLHMPEAVLFWNVKKRT